MEGNSLEEVPTADLMRQVLIEAKELIRIETRLARDELSGDLRQLKGAAIFGGVGLLVAVLTLSTLVVAIILALGGAASVALLVAAALLLGGSAVGFLAYQRLPKQPLQQTRERLKGDVIQLKERIAVHHARRASSALPAQIASGTTSDPSSAPSSRLASDGEASVSKGDAQPPRLRRKSQRGERRPHASWGERVKNIGTLLKEAGTQWSDDEAARLAASLALYTLLSIAPLLVVVVSVAGLVFGDEAARGQISQQLGAIVGPQAGDAIQNLVAKADTPSTGIVASIVSLAIVLMGASGVFGELQSALNRIWEVKPKPGRGIRGFLRDRFFSFAMVMGVAFLLLVSLVVSAGLAGISGQFKGLIPFPALWEVLNTLIAIGVTGVLFALIFKLVPDVKVAWKDVWVGGFVTALAFAIGRIALSWYVGRSATVSPFGAAGSLVALIVWIYYSAQILFMGAEFAQVYASHYGSRIVPSDNAVSIDADVEPAKPPAPKAV